ncbi:hypothetical protein Scep_003018 [Stephania cephalantha]|uniref:Receptor-like serine/threonine-protein kinase n=1 Tax=Stephania cephalantha TaxID=152367 RepID=A0AAP0Q4V7_9MAGN
MELTMKRRIVFIVQPVLFVFLILLHPGTSATTLGNNITGGQRLEDGQTLVSASQAFTLGFFSRGSSNSRYLGIWFNTNLVMDPVWVANRDRPISDTNGALTLQPNGVLTIVNVGDERNSTIVLNPNAAAASPTSRVIATLADSGNLVLTERSNNSSSGERLLWQSFDYPTDTLLPGMKLSINSSKNGRTRSLTSWISDKVPSSGSFTLGVDPKSNQLVTRFRGQDYWASGRWNGTTFGVEPSLTSAHDFTGLDKVVKFSFVSDEDERYFFYNYSGAGSNLPVLMWKLQSDGDILSNEMLRDTVTSDDFFIQCKIGGERRSGGCVRLKMPNCRTGEELFVQKRGRMDMNGPNTLPVMGDEGLSDCEARCRGNCSCIAYNAYDRNQQLGCQLWFQTEGARFVEDTGPQGSDVFVLSSTLGGKKNRWWLWLVIVVAIVSALLLLLVGIWWMRRRRQDDEEDTLLELQTISSSEEHGKDTTQFRLLSYTTIVAATNNFSPANKLGEGGFGPVYKGRLQEGQEIAVKKLSKSSGQGLTEFKNEIMLIAKLQHTNLVRLLGCSIKKEEKMLIYEYMPNKSLDFFLFDPSGDGRKMLDWRKRVNIIEGVAQGLLYLHKYSRLRIIHRDLKASNILLDAEMNPKISDFGMARIFGGNDSAANTNRIVGTYGYMSPEYAMEGIFSMKSDVFSYGVLLLEIVSGRKNTGFTRCDQHISLLGYAWDLWNKNACVEVIDPMLDSSCCTERFLRYIHVGLLCVQESADDRPIMSEVVSMLTSETMTLPQPRQPAFSVVRKLVADDEISEAKAESCSVNGMSTSVMEAR